MPRSTYEAICITLLPVGETGGARHVPPFVSARSNAEWRCRVKSFLDTRRETSAVVALNVARSDEDPVGTVRPRWTTASGEPVSRASRLRVWPSSRWTCLCCAQICEGERRFWAASAFERTSWTSWTSSLSTCTLHSGKLINYSPVHPPLFIHLLCFCYLCEECAPHSFNAFPSLLFIRNSNESVFTVALASSALKCNLPSTRLSGLLFLVANWKTLP